MYTMKAFKKIIFIKPVALNSLATVKTDQSAGSIALCASFWSFLNAYPLYMSC